MQDSPGSCLHRYPLLIMFTSAHFVATKLPLAILLVGSCCIFFVNGSSFVIDDERVKTLDISPALGRGYSVKTNQFHSICLDVDETTEPSYNYECKSLILLMATKLHSNSSQFEYPALKFALLTYIQSFCNQYIDICFPQRFIH